MPKYIEMKWLEGPAKDYTDRFMLEDFARKVEGVERVHPVIGPGGGKHHARCRLTVHGKEATLDYIAFEKYNDRHKMDPGILKFLFTDNSRTTIKDATWDGDTLNEYVEITYADFIDVDKTPPFLEQREYGLAQRLLRPRQAALYAELERTYGGRCCVTGCNVPFVLEAAHLIAAADEGADVASNALLLRADIHALLDSNQLGIHPKSRLVHISNEARAWPEYDKLHRVARLAEPQRGFESNSVVEEALVGRWNAFVEQHKRPGVSLA